MNYAALLLASAGRRTRICIVSFGGAAGGSCCRNDDVRCQSNERPPIFRLGSALDATTEYSVCEHERMQ